MKHEQVKHIIKDHCRKLRLTLHQIAPRFDIEAIHNFRVRYKKQRAFFRMIERQQTGRLKIAVSLKKTYQLAGKIRDLQLHQQRLADELAECEKQPIKYLNSVQQRIEELKPRLISMIHTKPVDECKKKTGIRNPEKFPTSSIHSYVKATLKDVKSLVKDSDLSDPNIHAIRKYLKDLLYNLSLFGKKKQVLLLPHNRGSDSKAFFKNLLDELGNYQDKHVGIQLLNEALLVEMFTDERDMLELIRSRLEDEKLLQKQVIAAQLNIFRIEHNINS